MALPDFKSIVETLKENQSKLDVKKKELDVELSASGFNNRYRSIMEKHVVNEEIESEDISSNEEDIRYFLIIDYQLRDIEIAQEKKVNKQVSLLWICPLFCPKKNN